MNYSTDEEKLSFIYQLLFSIATGRSYSSTSVAQIDSLKDEYGNIIQSILQTANQLEMFVLEKGFVPPYYSFQNISQLIFVLNDELKVQNYNQEVVHLLNYSSDFLLTLPFESLLTLNSQVVWNELIKSLKYFDTTELIFQTQDNLFYPLFCCISRMQNEKMLLVVSISAVPNQSQFLNFRDNTISSKLRSEIQILQKLHTYILDHLDEPLPKLSELAKIFATEVHILKIGFRKYYNTSIYQFYHEQRLQKAHIYIQETNILLKEIAFLCGFTSYMNFYKAFKKHFGYSPSVLLRPYLNTTD